MFGGQQRRVRSFFLFCFVLDVNESCLVVHLFISSPREDVGGGGGEGDLKVRAMSLDRRGKNLMRIYCGNRVLFSPPDGLPPESADQE